MHIRLNQTEASLWFIYSSSPSVAGDEADFSEPVDVEIDEFTAARWKKIHDDFMTMQTEMQQAVETGETPEGT
jgi:hypothetical protein